MFYCDFFIMGFLRMKEYWPSFLRISLTWVFLFFVLNGAGGSQWFGCYFFCPPLLIAPYTYRVASKWVSDCGQNRVVCSVDNIAKCCLLPSFTCNAVIKEEALI